MENTTTQIKKLLETKIGLVRNTLESLENKESSNDDYYFFKGYLQGSAEILSKINEIEKPLSLYQKVNEVERLNLLINSESEMIDDLEKEISDLEDEIDEYENQCDTDGEDYDTTYINDWRESIQIAQNKISRCESEIERYEDSLRLILK